MMKVVMVVVMVVQIMMMILSLLVQAPKMGKAVPWLFYWEWHPLGHFRNKGGGHLDYDEGGDGGGDGGTNYDDDIISIGPGPENGKSCTLVLLLGMEGTPLVTLTKGVP
jgi:hypothetical protein